MDRELLGWIALQLLWQGALIAALFAIGSAALGRARPQARYWLGVVSLSAMALCPPLTMALLGTSTPTWPSELAAWAPLTALGCSMQDNVSGLLVAWGVGAALLALRLVGGLALGARYLRHARPLPAAAVPLVEAVAERMGLTGRVRFAVSDLTQAPSVVGLRRPTVLLPAATLLALSPAQIEAVLAHELSHVARHDAAMNLGQCLLEALLFFHPAVWWISASVRMEREHCCDDAAADLGGGVDLARALGALAGARPTPRVLVAGTGGLLVQRVRRLLGGSARPMAPFNRVMATWMVFSVMLGVAGLRYDPGACQARPETVAVALPQEVGAKAMAFFEVMRRKVPAPDVELRRPRLPKVF